ncbi:uncharacterized protein LOC124682184 [Lolium rigidum]|uniref:uncharacterized protein LOC124682184 n=1 Tax=Lolium rigidum TaxID=89674 RepID=UPI001F5C98B4|nr:uncharacterized protein LOC124682184 [Lolium rigidum]
MCMIDLSSDEAAAPDGALSKMREYIKAKMASQLPPSWRSVPRCRRRRSTTADPAAASVPAVSPPPRPLLATRLSTAAGTSARLSTRSRGRPTTSSSLHSRGRRGRRALRPLDGHATGDGLLGFAAKSISLVHHQGLLGFAAKSISLVHHQGLLGFAAKSISLVHHQGLVGFGAKSNSLVHHQGLVGFGGYSNSLVHHRGGISQIHWTESVNLLSCRT